MPTLANPRHEILAQHIARGVKIGLAARKAGYLTDSSGYQAAERPDVQARVQEILEAAATVATMEVTEIIQHATTLARTDIREAFDLSPAKQRLHPHTLQPMVDADGNPMMEKSIELLHPREWNNEIAAAVSELSFDSNGNPKVKIVSRLDALTLLARVHGLLKDNVSLTGANGGPIETINGAMTPDQAADLYAMTLGKK